MSGKSARRNRYALRPHRFPRFTEKDVVASKSKESIVRHQHVIVPDAPVDHGRRIRGLAKSQGITIHEAAIKHAIKHAMKIGLKAAPSNAEATHPKQ